MVLFYRAQSFSFSILMIFLFLDLKLKLSSQSYDHWKWMIARWSLDDRLMIAGNICIFPFFSKIFSWQCWETYYCEYQIKKKPEVVLSKVQELAFVVWWWWWWWWWWCRCWWFWLNACNIYIFQLFLKKIFRQCGETYYFEYQIKKPEVVLNKVREFTRRINLKWVNIQICAYFGPFSSKMTHLTCIMGLFYRAQSFSFLILMIFIFF